MTDTVRLTTGLVRDMLYRPGALAGTPFSQGLAGVTVVSSSTTASVAGNILTVTNLGSGYLTPGNMITSASLPWTIIMEQLSGTLGGVGTYRVNNAQTIGSGTITFDGSGLWVYKDGIYCTFQASVDGTGGTNAITVAIDGSNDGLHPASTVLGTITITGGANLSYSDAITVISAHKYVRARVTALTGTNAVGICQMGV